MCLSVWTYPYGLAPSLPLPAEKIVLLPLWAYLYGPILMGLPPASPCPPRSSVTAAAASPSSRCIVNGRKQAPRIAPAVQQRDGWALRQCMLRDAALATEHQHLCSCGVTVRLRSGACSWVGP